MIFFLLFLLLIVFKSANSCKKNSFNSEYLNIENTNIIKGIFVILVIFSHSSQYINLKGIYDAPYTSFMGFLGQLVVSVFLFYSGYGIMESLKRKKFLYVKTIPAKRFLKVLVNFDIAVLLYLLLNVFLNNTYDIKTILLSFIGWENIGNSNWYILAILALYLLTFIAFFPLKWKEHIIWIYIYTILFTALSIGFVYFEIKMGKQSYYYNTIILYSFGMWYSLLKPYIETVLFKNDIVYSCVCALCSIILYFTFINRGGYGIESYSLWAIAFTTFLILFTMKFTFKSTILSWFGTHIFSIYILQRIPMMIFHYLGISRHHKYFFILLSLISSVCIAQIFEYLTGKMWNKISDKKPDLSKSA